VLKPVKHKPEAQTILQRRNT